MLGDLLAAVGGLALAAAIVYSRRGSSISHAVLLAAPFLAVLYGGVMSAVALALAFAGGYGYRVEREKARGR